MDSGMSVETGARFCNGRGILLVEFPVDRTLGCAADGTASERYATNRPLLDPVFDKGVQREERCSAPAHWW